MKTKTDASLLALSIWSKISQCLGVLIIITIPFKGVSALLGTEDYFIGKRLAILRNDKLSHNQKSESLKTLKRIELLRGLCKAELLNQVLPNKCFRLLAEEKQERLISEPNYRKSLDRLNQKCSDLADSLNFDFKNSRIYPDHLISKVCKESYKKLKETQDYMLGGLN